MKLKETFLIEEHRKLNAKLGAFGGWLMPIQYEGIIAEHNHTRSSVSLFDICHMGEFIIKGDPEKTGLNNIITSNLNKMKTGECHYGFILNDEGKILDDVITYKIREDEWMLVVNAATTDQDAQHIKKNLSSSTSFEDISERTGKLDLQGPDSREALRSLAGDGINNLKYYSFSFFDLLGEKVLISRTGYTGELGYEIYISSKNIKNLWNTLLKNDKIKPAGLGARDTLRLEVCMPLYGQDIDNSITPLEAGFDKFVDFNKNFIGKEKLIEKKEKGVARKLAFFKTESRRAPRHNFKIYDKDNEIGTVTSGSFSPSLLCGIGMGYIDVDTNKIGSKITLKDDNVSIDAIITGRPFYKEGSVKS